jgi:hypothetical protein
VKSVGKYQAEREREMVGRIQKVVKRKGERVKERRGKERGMERDGRGGRGRVRLRDKNIRNEGKRHRERVWHWGVR